MSEVTQDVVVAIDWTKVENTFRTDGKIKLAQYAKENNIAEADFRDALKARYGDRLTFKRGRTGGTFLNNP